jgi:hypothetical protein
MTDSHSPLRDEEIAGRMLSMRWMMPVWTVLFCLWAIPSQAAVLDPWAVTSLGTLNASEPVDIDADMLDPVSGAGIFTFHDITGTNRSTFGTRTLGLLSRDSIAFTGMIDLRGTIDAGSRPLEVIAAENITLSGEARSGNIGLSSGREIVTTGTGITGRTLSLGSGIVTLTGGTVSGSTNFGVNTDSSTGVIIGSAGATLVAPVPVPASFLLFATGFAAVGLVKRRKV